MAAAQITMGLVAGIVSVLVQRHYGPVDMGLLRTASTYALIISILSEMGITRAAVISISRGDEMMLRKVAGQIVGLRTMCCGVYLVVAWILALASARTGHLEPRVLWLTVAWSFSMVMQAFRRNSEAMFQASERLVYQAGLFFGYRMVLAAATILVISLDLKIEYLVYATVLCDGLDATISWMVVRRRIVRPLHAWDWGTKLRLLKIGWPFAIQTFAGTLYVLIDTVLLVYWCPGTRQEIEGQIGLYGSSYTIVILLTTVPVSLAAALFPQMSRAYHEKNGPRLYSLFTHGISLMAIVAVPLVAFFFMFRYEVIRYILGPAYLDAIPMLGTVIWALGFIFLSIPCANLLAATDKQHAVNVSAILCGLFNIGLNYWLIPLHRGLGAAISTSITELLNLLVLAGFIMFWHIRGFRWNYLGAVLLLQICAVCVILFVDTWPLLLKAIIYLFYAAICGGSFYRMMRNRKKAGQAAA